MTDFSLPGSEGLAAGPPETIWKLSAEEELRIEIEPKGSEHKCVIQLLSGTAELFGTELLLDREYTFSPSVTNASAASSTAATPASSSADESAVPLRFAIFTWHGCELRVRGTPKTAYKKSDTPMISYLNAHAALENMRELTKAKRRATGPRTMVLGPMDTGKSTLCRILLSYAVRAGHKPLFVDLDVGQNAISIPGSMSATSIEHPISVELAADMGGGGGSAHTLSIKSPLTCFYGHTTPQAAPELYARLMAKLAAVVERRLVEHPGANAAGIVINTCGWIDSEPGSPAYELLISIAQTFAVDVVLVLDRDDLTQQLKNDKRLGESKPAAAAAGASGAAAATPTAATPAAPARTVSVAQLSKSGGVATRDQLYRRRARTRALREYFYGSQNELTPHQKVLQWKEVELYRIGGGPAVPNSALPIGAKRLIDPLKLTRVQPSVDLVSGGGAILACSYAKDSSTLLDSNVAGFVHVTAVDVQKKTLTILTPAPGPLPNHIFIVGAIKWTDQ